MKKFLRLVILFPPLLFTAFTLFADEAKNISVEQRLADAAQLYFSHKHAEALNEYLKISKETQHKDAFLNAAFIALEQNNPRLAADTAFAAFTRYPQDREIIETAAQAYLADGQYAAAEKLLSQLSLDPKRDGFLYINLARAQIGLGEKDLAKYNLRLAARGQTHPALANYLLGRLLEEEHNYQQAVEPLEAASAYDHQFIEAKKHYAFVLEKTGDYNNAYRQYRMLYAADKKDAQVTQALQRLRSKITRPEKELTEQKPLREHTLVKPILPQKIQEIKIGLGVRSNGKPAPRTEVIFIPSHDFTITDEHEKILQRAKAKETWKVQLIKHTPYLISPSGKKTAFRGLITVNPVSHTEGEGHTILVKHLLSGAGMTWASLDDKEYRGKLQIRHTPKLNTLIPINIVNMEEYLQGVISSEMPTLFPMDALRAQAVLARTYATKHLGKHRAYGYDVCDTQNCQVYGGVTAESERANAAVESTMGEILTYQDTPIESVFSANTGGITQSSKEAGWSETPYLQPVSDYKDFDFEHLQPYHLKELLQYPHEAFSKYDKNVSLAAFRWTRVVDEPELRDVIKRQKKDIGTITAIIPLKRGRSGYVSQLKVKGTKGEVILNKENVIRNNLSLGLLRSSYFVVEPHYEKRQLKYFVFYGGGWGHGVGFDQTGAAGRAEEGQDYKTILKHYFPLAELSGSNKN